MCLDSQKETELSINKLSFRRARSVVVLFVDDQICVHNFLTHTSFSCNTACLQILSEADQWKSLEDLIHSYSSFSRKSIVLAITDLCQNDALVVKNSGKASHDEIYESIWKWGAIAGFYHFGIRNSRWDTPEETIEFMQKRASEVAPPPFLTNECYEKVVSLPEINDNNVVFSTMLKRQSHRKFGRDPISKNQLGECLFAGLGITSIEELPIFGVYPKKMTPSGGARNPYEAYVYVRSVEGLAQGIYHYSAFEHTLGMISQVPSTPVSALLGGQTWADDAAAIVFLVAHYTRTMWKYPHPNGYRVVLIEAGHIAQNMVLVSSMHGLASITTCAIVDSLADDFLQLTQIAQSVPYAILIGTT